MITEHNQIHISLPRLNDSLPTISSSHLAKLRYPVERHTRLLDGETNGRQPIPSSYTVNRNLSFHKLTYSVDGKSNATKCIPCINSKTQKVIINDVSGMFHVGLHAIMGKIRVTMSMKKRSLYMIAFVVFLICLPFKSK
jgi:hypothetical protein